VSPQTKQTIIQTIRDFFLQKNFEEIETPTLYPTYPIEPGITLFQTNWYHRHPPSPQNPSPKTTPLYLAPSPETHLKKLLVNTPGNYFTFAKAFRNEPSSPQHNPEFTILEWYELKKDYQDVKKTTQTLIHHLGKKLNSSSCLTYQNQKIDLTPPWPTYSLKQAFQEFADLDLSKNLNFKSIKKTAQNKGYNTENEDEWEPLYNQIFLNEVEPKLLEKHKNQPIILNNYPTRLSPLCKPQGNGFSQRFEFYIGGIELGDCYTELTDPDFQQKNFQTETAFRLKYNLPTHPYDKQLIKALQKGLPECSGIAIGIDRLAMLFANTTNIADINHFVLK